LHHAAVSPVRFYKENVTVSETPSLPAIEFFVVSY